MQIGIKVAAQGKRVLYVNFEMSEQQWAKRYPEKVFPDTLFIANIDYAAMHDVTEQGQMLEGIQRIALQHSIEVLIIYNFTKLCINSKESSEAGNVMLQLISLHFTHNWTMKFRSYPIVLDEKNVHELQLTSADGWLHFEFGDYDEERKHLPRSRDEKEELERDIVKELKECNGLSYREIADKLETSHSMVDRTARKFGLSRKKAK